jgi:hypothetical protein
MRHLEDGPDDAFVMGISGPLTNEIPVNLQTVHIEAFEISEVGVAGSEIVNRKMNADFPGPTQYTRDVTSVCNFVLHVVAAELRGRNIDRHHKMAQISGLPRLGKLPPSQSFGAHNFTGLQVKLGLVVQSEIVVGKGAPDSLFPCAFDSSI